MSLTVSSGSTNGEIFKTCMSLGIFIVVAIIIVVILFYGLGKGKILEKFKHFVDKCVNLVTHDQNFVTFNMFGVLNFVLLKFIKTL